MTSHPNPPSGPRLRLVHSARPVPACERLLRLPDVEGIVGLKRSTIYELMKKGEFPRQISISRRFSAWPESVVQTWVQTRISGGVQ
jgi:prophage regulatory protein